jgi:sialate O-acetylesterase
MVLQRGKPVPVWGAATPGEKIVVRFGNQSGTSTADAGGSWRIDLDAMPASSEGRDFVVSGSDTPKPLVLEDVLVGEVWLASGQSNMDFTVSKTRAWYGGVPDEEAEIKAADYPLIRMFSGERAMREKPRDCVGGQWLVCNPENVPGFSAVAYFFARDLHQALKVPVGIVCIAYGGSTAEAWIRREALDANPALRPMIDKLDAAITNFNSSITDWKKIGEDRLAWEKETILAFKEGRRSRIAQNKEDPTQNNHNPTVLFNGMLHPVIPYVMRGVIWYQGESIVNGNAGRDLYPLVQATLVRDWRKLWNIGDFPFYIVQLASHETTAPQVRQAQATILNLPNSGIAVTIDIGERKDIHPRNKKDVGKRLANIALAKTYKQDIEYSGPWLESARTEESALRLAFSHAAGGLVVKEGPLRCIEIAGTDGKFVPAESTIEGNAIIVRHPDVPKPVSARYAWSGYPEGCNLYNQAGLPAAPFHTDQLPLPEP